MGKQRRVSLIIILFYILSVFFGGHLYWNSTYQNQVKTNLSQLKRFSDQLSSQLEKYAYIPRLIAKDSEVINVLKDPANSTRIDIANRHLESVNSIVGVSDTYLLDQYGKTIASSNWQKTNTFIGQNFAFRPYFVQALEGNQGQYFALGSTSGKRGFYYSFPVIDSARVLGVAVIKTELSNIERNWPVQSHSLIVSDTNGVTFMSNHSDWLFKSLTPLTQENRQKIKASQRYLDRNILSLGFLSDHHDESGELTTGTATFYQNTFLSSKSRISSQNLTVRVISPKAEILWSTLRFLFVVTLAYALVFTCWLLIRNRQIKQHQIARLEAESRQKLEFQVMERTAEFHAEIKERQKTEQALIQTQEELIQAAKLAVLGEMSASISHELNNPLAAIRSFAENGKKFLEKDQPERTAENLARISALTDRMAKISQQLKSFARKSSSDDLITAQIQPIILSATELMKTRIRSHQIKLENHLSDKPVSAKVNPIQLEQVLINLINNAIEATESSEKKQINITLYKENRAVKISIKDTGSGITNQMKTQLFKPFYTTKQNGLGLGLSISLQIMQSMGGNLEIDSKQPDGACFVISLTPADNEDQEDV